MNEPRYEVYRRRNVFGRKRWRFRYRAANGEIISAGQPSGYSRQIDCEHAIALLKASADSPIRYLTGD